MQFSDLLQKGVTFPPEGPPLFPQDIARWEQIAGAPFPEQYRDYLLHANGGKVRLDPAHKPDGYYEFTIRWPEDLSGMPTESYFDYLFMIKEVEAYGESFSLTFDYNYRTWEHVLPPGTFPIGCDITSNYLLIGLTGEIRGKIFFWLFESADPRENPDVAAYAYLGQVADSFTEFILSLEYRP
jgi:hypothetical protein